MFTKGGCLQGGLQVVFRYDVCVKYNFHTLALCIFQIFVKNDIRSYYCFRFP